MSALFLERQRCTRVEPFMKTPDAANESLYWAPWSISWQPEPAKGERPSNFDSANAEHKEEFFCDWS